MKLKNDLIKNKCLYYFMIICVFFLITSWKEKKYNNQMWLTKALKKIFPSSTNYTTSKINKAHISEWKTNMCVMSQRQGNWRDVMMLYELWRTLKRRFSIACN